jgi:copper chaperone NosL
VKKIFLTLVMVAVVGAVIVTLFLSLADQAGPRYVFKDNRSLQPVALEPHVYLCSECNMQIETLAYASQVVLKNGLTYFFDDIGCVVLWLEDRKPEVSKIYTMTLDTHHWIEAEKAHYTRSANTPMGYGMAAYEKPFEGNISYAQMRLLMLRGEHLHDPFIKKLLIDHPKH